MIKCSKCGADNEVLTDDDIDLLLFEIDKSNDAGLYPCACWYCGYIYAIIELEAIRQ